MTREDILQAIGTVEESRLARCEKNREPSMVIHEEDSNMKNGKYSNTRRSAGVKRIWLIAAVIALAIFIVFAINAIKLIRMGKKEREIGVTLFASATGFLLCGITDCLFYGLKPLQYFMMVLGISQAAFAIYLKKKKDK